MVYTFIDHRNDVKMFKTQKESYEHFDVIYKIQNVNSLFVCLFFQITLIYTFLTSKIERVLGKKTDCVRRHFNGLCFLPISERARNRLLNVKKFISSSIYLLRLSVVFVPQLIDEFSVRTATWYLQCIPLKDWRGIPDPTLAHSDDVLIVMRGTNNT